MKTSNLIFGLSLLIVVLALIAAGAGLLWPEGGESFSYTTLRGQEVQIYGQGLYQNDTLFMGAGNRGLDLVLLFLSIPALFVSALLYRRGSLRGKLLLVGMLSYFLYVYVSMAFATAYNPLFLLYVAIFSAGFFGFVLAFSSVDLRGLGELVPQMPRTGLAIFMFFSGAVTLFVWGEPLVTALLRGGPPPLLDTYTSPFTLGLDLAIIVPTTFITGVLVLRRQPLGYLLAIPLLCLIILLVPQIILQTILQVSAGVAFTVPQLVGPIGGFLVLGFAALWFIAGILRPASYSESGSHNLHTKKTLSLGNRM